MGMSVRDVYLRYTTPFTAGFRPDIQGLRALAVVLVLLYHADLGVSGGYVGVDVFFVISGFLITGLLAQRAERDGRVSLLSFYAARFRRLTAPALVVLVVTIGVAWAIGPPMEFSTYCGEAIASALFVVNIWFARQGLDYQRSEALPSPFLHYWSLSVEEQFYVVWPIGLALCLWFFGRRRFRRSALIAVSMVTMVSFAVSVWSTGDSAPLAYFGLHSRAWELGIGAILALVSRRVILGPILFVVVGFTAVATIVFSALLYDDRTAFPGVAAVVPVMATALLLVIGDVDRTLPGVAHRVVQHIGDISYSLYLWHWPVLALAAMPFRSDVPLAARMGLLALSYALAFASFRLLENPVRQLTWAPRIVVPVGVAVIATTILIIGVVRSIHPGVVVTGKPVTMVQPVTAGELATILDDAVVSDGPVPNNVQPQFTRAGLAPPKTTTVGCQLGFRQVDAPECEFGDPNSKKKIVLFGDSHAEHWFPGLEKAAEDNGYMLYSWTKASCGIIDHEIYYDRLRRNYFECTAWREKTIQRIRQIQPDIIVLAQGDNSGIDQLSSTQWAQSTGRMVDQIVPLAKSVFFILDTPWSKISLVDCVSTRTHDPDSCNISLDSQKKYDSIRSDVRHELDRRPVTVVDGRRFVCAASACPSVVGNLLVMRDGHHLSRSYSAWLAPVLATELGLTGS